MSTMRFTKKHIQSFLNVSGDQNPLHCDEVYSRTTQFGETVVFGIAAVLYGLAEWSKGRPFSIIRIRGEFGKPLFLDQIYNIEIGENGQEVQLSIYKERELRMTVEFEWSPWQRAEWPKPKAEAASIAPSGDFDPTVTDYRYDPSSAHMGDFLKAFNLEAGQIPFSQLSALLWSSFFVGMRFPGRQALYADFEFHFDGLNAPLQVQNLETRFDDRFAIGEISGSGTGIKNFRINAFRRPEPVRYRLKNFPPAGPAPARLKGKSVFISGASRGFGSVLALAFGRFAKRVFLNFRSAKESAEDIRRDLSQIGCDVILVEADLESPTGRQLAYNLVRDAGGLDILINNASPVIDSRMLAGQSMDAVLSFVNKSMAIALGPTIEFLPILNPEGMIIQISTIYMNSPPPGFSHYLCAKGALEGFSRALAAEIDNRSVIIARAPKMLTDQTNAPLVMDTPLNPVNVAVDLLNALDRLPAGNFHEINL